MRQTHFYFVGVILCALLCLVACDETQKTRTANPSNTKTSTPQEKTPSTQGPLAFNTSVRRIPPRSFNNHWGTTAPAAKKKVDLSAFYSRPARRISLKKLRASVPYLLGGTTWTDGAGRNMFDRYALTLGRANYLQLNKNNDSVTKLFMKLMDDMSTNVCKKVIVADYKRAASARVFVRNEKDIYANLRFIRLKFHAVHVPTNSTTGLTGLKSLYDKTLAKTKDKKKAWELVCIAVLTSPEFYTY